MRDPADITKRSAINVAKSRIEEILAEDQNMGTMARIAMKSAIQPGGGLYQIADMLYDMGLRISIDKNNPEHQDWLKIRAVELEK